VKHFFFFLILFFPYLAFSQNREQELQWAIENGDARYIYAYLQSSLFPQNLPNGRNTLLYALEQGHRETVRLLLGRVQVEEDQDGSLVDTASSQGRIDLLNLLVERGLNLESLNDRGESALFPAARLSHGRLVRYLLSRGLDPNHLSITGASPLLHAVQSNNLEGARLLVDGGADPQHRDLFGRGLERYLPPEPSPELENYLRLLLGS